MTISVIIPTLNEAQNIRATLDRLHHPAFSEILAAEGGSQDGTVALAAPVAKVLTAPTGRARQMKLLPPTAADDITAALADPRVVGGHFNARITPDRGLLWLVGRMMSWRARLTGIATGDQAIFVRRNVFEQLGGFPDIPLMEDIAFSRRLKRAGRVAALRSCVMTSGRRWEQHGVARTILLMWWLRLLFFLGVSPDRLKRLYVDAR